MGNSVGSLEQLKQTERDILIGALLGDAHARKVVDNRNARIEFTHSLNQKEYLFWKYQQLERWCNRPPYMVGVRDRRYGRIWYSWRFNTKSHECFTELWQLFYRNAIKIIPSTINRILKSSLSLAIWYMDDGGRRNDSYGVFLNTLSFTKKEHELLRKCLKKNFKINSRIHWITDGYRLYIPSMEAKRFSSLVHPYCVDTLQYKLPYNPVTTSFARLDRARDRS